MAGFHIKDEKPISVFQRSVYLYALYGTLGFSIFFAFIGLTQITALGFLVALGYGAAYLLARIGREVWAHFMALAVICAQTYITDSFLGWSFGLHYHLLAAFALLSISTRLKTYVIVLSDILILASFFFFKILSYDSTPIVALPPRVLGIVGDVNLFAAFGVIAYSLYRYRRAYVAAERRLDVYHGTILRIANTDALTGIANRRHIQESLSVAVADAQASSSSLAVALADMDNFKRINDTFGHDCGDAALKEACRRFQQVLRKTDALGRWGGEEFLFLLHGSGLEQARDAMERLRMAVSSVPLIWNGESIFLGVTIGVSAFRPGLSAEELTAEADRLLYAGKRAGRNRVMTKEDGGSEAGHVGSDEKIS